MAVKARLFFRSLAIRLSTKLMDIDKCWGEIPLSREGHQAAIVGSRMLMFGGVPFSNDDSILQLDLQSNRWVKLSFTYGPSERAAVGMIVYENVLYLLGGLLDESGFVVVNDVWSINFNTLDVTLTSDCILYSQIVVTGKLNVTGVPKKPAKNHRRWVESLVQLSGGELVVRSLNLMGEKRNTKFGISVLVNLRPLYLIQSSQIIWGTWRVYINPVVFLC